MFCWSGQILRIDLSKGHYAKEPVEAYTEQFVAGRGINVKLVFDEAHARISPFGPENKLVIGPGMLAGTPAPAASRTQITTVLPNGLLNSSGIGGFLGGEIKHAGYDNIVIQGTSAEPVYMYVDETRVEFRDARHIWGKNIRETQQIIKEELHDQDVQIMCIGPAGENLVSFSCIMTGLTSAAGHGGYGAVMGSKNLKAVAFRGRKAVTIAKLDEFLNECLDIRKILQESPAFQAMITSGGRTNAVDAIRAGMTAMGNFEDSHFDKGIVEDLEKRGKIFWDRCRTGSTGCLGCPVHHFHVFDVPDLGTGAPKCAAWASFATPLWNTDYDLMYQAGDLCNRYGLDFVSTANIIGFLMELYHKGIIAEHDTDTIPMKRGDRDAILTTINKIATQEGFGALFKNGLSAAAQTIGKGAEECAMHIKNREMPISEMRPFKGMALAFAVCRDPLDALPVPELAWFQSKEFAEKMAFDLCKEKESANPDSYKKKGSLVAAMESMVIVVEILGLCKWFLLNLTPSLEIPSRLLSLATGQDFSEDTLLSAAERARTLERAVNVIQGARRKDDTLPRRLLQEPVSGGPFKGAALDKEKLDKMVDDYYTIAGWDEYGAPKQETFAELNLLPEAEIFSRRIKREGKADA